MSRALTIALPISSFFPNLGGMEVGLHNIASRLVKRGHRPVVIAPALHVLRLKKEGWSLPYEVFPLPPKLLSNLHRFPLLGFAAFNLFFAWIQRRFKFDVWHITMGYPLGVAMVHFAKHRSDVHYLIRCAGDDIQVVSEIGYGMRLNPVIDKLVRDYLPQSQMLIAISESVKCEYLELGVAEEVIRYVPNGVALERFVLTVDREQVRALFSLKQKSFVFLSVGRNHPKKNYSMLIKAAGLLQSMTNKSFEVVLVGSGVEALEQDKKLFGNPPVQLISEIGDTKLLNKIPEIPGKNLVDLYLAADVFVFPSLVETFGIVIIEAMAAGLPVIVGDSPGCRDIIRNGMDGIMVDPLNPIAIAEKMLLLMSNVARREDYAKRARTRAESFSWETVVDDYCSLYHESMQLKKQV